MNSDTLRKLWIALGALLAVWLVFTLVRRAGRDETERLALGAVDTKTVDQVLLVKGADTLRFVRQGEGWTVNGQRADAKLVDQLLQSVGDSAARSELVAESASSHARLGLDSTTARRLTVRQGDRVVAELLLGSRGAGYGSVHVRRPGEAASYLTAGGLADVADRPLDDWRDKVIAQIAPESVATVELTAARKSWRLTREDSGWTLGSVPADSAAVASLLDRYRTLTASGFPTSAQVDSARFDPPDKVARLLASDGRVLLHLSADSLPSLFVARREGDPTTYRLDTWAMSGLVPDEASLRKK
jgi:hypothetical protein